MGRLSFDPLTQSVTMCICRLSAVNNVTAYVLCSVIKLYALLEFICSPYQLYYILLCMAYRSIGFQYSIHS